MKNYNTSFSSAPAIADLNNDNYLDVVGTYMGFETSAVDLRNDNLLWSHNYDGINYTKYFGNE